jgi:hypothetical protein
VEADGRDHDPGARCTRPWGAMHSAIRAPKRCSGVRRLPAGACTSRTPDGSPTGLSPSQPTYRPNARPATLALLLVAFHGHRPQLRAGRLTRETFVWVGPDAGFDAIMELQDAWRDGPTPTSAAESALTVDRLNVRSGSRLVPASLDYAGTKADRAR